MTVKRNIRGGRLPIFDKVWDALKKTAKKTKLGSIVVSVMDRLGLDEYDMAILIAVAAGQPGVAEFIEAYREAEQVVEFAKTGIPPKPPGYTQEEWEKAWKKIRPKLKIFGRNNPTAFNYLDFKAKQIKRYDPSDKGQSPVDFQQSLLGPSDNQGQRAFGKKLDKAKAKLKKYAIPIAGLASAVIISIAAGLSKAEKLEEPERVIPDVDDDDFFAKLDKQLGNGSLKIEDAKKLQKLLIDMTPGINDVSGGGLLTKIINKTVDTHNRFRKKKSDPKDIRLANNEVHAVFKNKDGALARAQFCGPGTEIVKKIKRLNHKHKGDVKKMVDVSNFVSEADKICMMHDLNYYLDGKNNPKGVRKADLKMIDKLREAERKGESKFNTGPSKLGIKAKIKLEDLGIIRKGSFAEGGAEEKENPKNVRLMRKVQAQLKKEGYGNVKDRPKRQSQSPWVKFVKAYAEKHDVSYRDALQQAAPLYRAQKNN